MEMSAPWLSASMKALVPDLAIVPRLVISYCLVMPIPVSLRTRVLVALSGMMSILKAASSPTMSGSVSDLYLILSRASDALEMSSLRKISLLVQKVLMMRPISCWMSALMAKCSSCCPYAIFWILLRQIKLKLISSIYCSRTFEYIKREYYREMHFYSLVWRFGRVAFLAFQGVLSIRDGTIRSISMRITFDEQIDYFFIAFFVLLYDNQYTSLMLTCNKVVLIQFWKTHA